MWTAPSLDALSKSVRDAFKAEVPGTDPWIWPNTLYIIGKVFAGLMRGLYQRIEFVGLQRFASTATAEYLDLHGSEVGLSRVSATYATGACDVTFSPLTMIPAGTRLLRADGLVFVVDNDFMPTASPASVPVRSNEPVIDANTVPATVLTLETPIAGVGDFVVDDDGLTGGSDGETDESFRARILDRKRNPPHGGSPSEYVAWARATPGVTRVYVQRATPAAGDVTVYFMMDDSIYASGIPSAGMVATVQASLEAQAPANANIIVAAPTATAVPVTITAMAPDNARTREAVTTELKTQFRRRAVPEADFLKRWIDEAIQDALGDDGSYTLSAPAADTSIGAGHIAVIGTVTFP